MITRAALLASWFAAGSVGGDPLASIRHGLDTRVAQLESAGPHARAMADETLSVFAPLAERLGFPAHRVQLEDASLRILDPSAWADLSETDREADLLRVVAATENLLTKLEIDGAITSRVKSRYSTLRKMERKGVSRAAIVDRLGVRVRVATASECYAVMDQVHRHFVPIEGTFDDYIASPKPNGYASLHSAVRVAGVGPVEFQVRTEAMHRAAEDGEAAHWRYKDV